MSAVAESNVVITDSAVLAFIHKIESLDLSATSASDFEMFKYMGFNPIDFVKALMAIQRKKAIGVNDFVDDIKKMIAIGIFLGNPSPSNLQKRDERGVLEITRLTSLYGLQQSAKGTDSSTITIPRIVSSFPIHTMNLLQIIGSRVYSGPLGSTGLPWYMRHRVFPSCVPKSFPEEIKNFLFYGCLAFGIEESAAVSKNREWEQIANDQINFIRIAHESPIPDEETRKTFFKTLNIQADFKKIQPIARKVRQMLNSDTTKAPTLRNFTKELLAITGGPSRDIPDDPPVSESEDSEESDDDQEDEIPASITRTQVEDSLLESEGKDRTTMSKSALKKWKSNNSDRITRMMDKGKQKATRR